jgi:hypothetical protein
MKKIAISLIVLFIISFTFSEVNSQNIKKFGNRDVWEIGGSIGFSSSTPVFDGVTGNTTWTLDINPYCGYFVTPGLELGVMPSISYVKYGKSTELWDYTLYFAPAYNFMTKSIVHPFVMGLIGYDAQKSGSYSANGLAWGGEGGLKINAYGNSLLLFALQYEQRTLTPKDYNGDRIGENNFKIKIGYNIFF